MTHVHNHPHTIHLADHLLPHAGDSGILIFITSGRQQALVVVGKLHETDSETVENFHQSDVILDGRTVLAAENDGGPVLACCSLNLLGTSRGSNEIRKLFESPVPRDDVFNRFPKIFMIGDGHMHGGDSALTKLIEDLLRPIVILEGIDDHLIRLRIK